MKGTKSPVPTQTIKPNQFILSRLNYWTVVMLGSLAALLFLWKLGQGSQDDWDEAIYAQVSKEIVQSGDWLTLHWEYKPWFHKPPLFMWSTAIFFKLFGVNEFWARAASAFSGIVLVIITYLIGKLVYDRSVGLLAAVVLLTSYQFVDRARFGTTDMMLTLFTFLAIYAYLSLEEENQKWWYMVWLSCALAFMVKGIGGLIAPMVIILSLLLDRNFLATLKSRHFWQGLLLAFILVAPWHIIMYIQHGQTFILEYLGYHILARATTPLEGNVGGPFFYVQILQKLFFPWFYLLPFAVALSIKENITHKSRSRILFITFFLVFGLYTLIKSKLEWYILPVYPVLAILIAFMVKQAFKTHQSVAFSGLLFGVVMVALVAPLKIVLIFVGLGLLVLLLYLVVKKQLPYQVVAVVMTVFFVLVGIKEIRPLYYKGETPIAQLARIAASTDTSNREPLIVAYFSSGTELYSPTALFYSNRPIQLASNPKELANFTKDRQNKEIILAKKDIEPFLMDYEVNIMSEAQPLVYATIKPRN